MRNLPLQSFKEAQRTRMKRAQTLTTYELARRGSSRSKCASAPHVGSPTTGNTSGSQLRVVG